MSKNAISLYELNEQIKGVISDSFSRSVWIRAEIAELRENRNGHCYLDLVEKDEASNQITARMKAMIWSYTFRMLKPYFETSTGRPLSQGIKIMIQGNVEFQEVYGMSFVIRDIDPTYTLGDLEQRRREVINRLTQEGVLSMNKELELPVVSQKIAIISSPTAAGYGDFIHQIENNASGIKFYHKLFPAIMQGDTAAASIATAFDSIYEYAELFDVVIIIRGGGASLDLLCFDDYWLAYNITQFPLPVLTGIGHERDLSVADMVAHTSLKTPTAVAEFLISGATQLLNHVEDLSLNLQDIVNSNINHHKQYLEKISYTFAPMVAALLKDKSHQLRILTERIPHKTQTYLNTQSAVLAKFNEQLKDTPQRIIREKKNALSSYKTEIETSITSIIKRRKEKLEFLNKTNKLNDPAEILKRGFSLTYLNGKIVKEQNQLKNGDFIETQFRDGKAVSEVREVLG